MNLKDMPRRFIIRADHLIMKDLGLEKDAFGVYYPNIGCTVIMSEQRGFDELDMHLEDVEWMDFPEDYLKVEKSMLKFDKVPVMDKEYFEECLKTAKSFQVCVQINPGLQRTVKITKEQAMDIAYDGLKIMPIWGQIHDDCLQISLGSQWLDTLKR